MKTYLKNQKFSLFARNFVYLEIKISAEENAVESKEKDTNEKPKQNIIEWYEIYEESLKKGTNIETDIKKTFNKLAPHHPGAAERMGIRFLAGFSEIASSMPPTINTAQDLWKRLADEKAIVKIVQNNDNWVFKFEDADGNDVLEKISKERTTIPVASTPSPDGAQATLSTPETAPIATESKPEKNKHQLIIAGKSYNILHQYDLGRTAEGQEITSINYYAIAAQILDESKILDPSVVEEVKKTRISVKEYGDLLRASHEASGKGRKIPLVMPYQKTTKTTQERLVRESQQVTETASAREAQNRAESTRLWNETLLKIAGQTERNERLQTIYTAFDNKYRAAKTEQEKTRVVKNLEATLNRLCNRPHFGHPFPIDGVERSMNPKIAELVNDAKSWKDAWKNESIQGIRQIKTVFSRFPIFQAYANNPELIRDVILKAVTEGKNDNIYPSDLLKFMDLNLPPQMKEAIADKSYGQLLAQTMIDPKTKNPELNNLYQQGVTITVPLEQLTNAVSGLTVGIDRGTVATRQRNLVHERTVIAENDDSAKGLQNMVTLLNPEKSGAIYRMAAPNETATACKITYLGRDVALVIDPPGSFMGKWDIYLVEPSQINNFEKNSLLHLTDSAFLSGFNGEEHVNKIRTRINAMPTNSRREINTPTGKGYAIDMSKFGNQFTSLSRLEQIRRDQKMPGAAINTVPTLLNNKESKYFSKLKEVLTFLRIPDTDVTITDAGLHGMQEDDNTIANIRYRGRNLTMKIEKNMGWMKVQLREGFNHSDFDKGFSVGWNSKKSWNNLLVRISNFMSELPPRITAATVEESGIIPKAGLTDALNAKLPGPQYGLKPNQLLELVFNIYSFEDLQRTGVIQQVEGAPNKFVLIKLPPELDKKTLSPSIIRLAYQIKWPGYLKDEARTAEMSQESADRNRRYMRNLYRLFPGAARLGEDGERLNMPEVQASGQAGTPTEDLFYQSYSDQAAFNILYPSVKKYDENEKRYIVDIEKGNKELTDLYRKGVQFLMTKGGLPKKYQSMRSTIQGRNDLKSRNIDMNLEIDKWDLEIIRLGFIFNEKIKEASQNQELNDALALHVADGFYDEIRKQDPSITKEQLIASVKQFPVGLLLTYQYNRAPEEDQSKHTLGLHVPITIPLSENTNLALVPGIQTNKRAQFAVGISSKKDIGKIRILGGVSMGFGAGKGGFQMGPSVRGEISHEVKFFTDDKSYKEWLGIGAGAGFSLENGMLGVEAGPFYQWEVQAQEKFDKEFNQYMIGKYGPNIQNYMDFLKGNETDKTARLAAGLRANPNMMGQLTLSENPTDAEVVIAFEDLIYNETNAFMKDFSLPSILGGRVDITAGTIMLTTAATGNVPVAIGAAGKFAINFLLSLRINMGSKEQMTSAQRTSERELAMFEQFQQQKVLSNELDKSFGTQPQRDQKVETGGRLSYTGNLDVRAEGKVTQIENTPFQNNLLEYNKKFHEIGMELVKDDQGRIEIVFLPSMEDGNVKVFIGNDIAVMQGGKLYLENPNKLDGLYFYRNNRFYPQAIRNNATTESVIMISKNRFFTAEGNMELPKEIVLTKRNGEKSFTEELNASQGTPEKYNETPNGIPNAKEITDTYNSIRQSLYKGPIELETTRENLTAVAEDMYKWKNKQGESFLSITNIDGQEAINKPAYEKEQLAVFMDDYATNKNISPPFNGTEKEQLLLEMSVLRYTKLPGNDRQKFEKRMEWIRKNVLVPTFQQRIDNLTARDNVTFTQTADQMANKAVADILSSITGTDQQTTALEDGTHVAVVIGRMGPNGTPSEHGGMHHLLNAKNIEGEFGYIMGPQYNEALQNRTPIEDYELALVLMEQLSPLPRVELTNFTNEQAKEFTSTLLAQHIASNIHLGLVMGIEKYKQLDQYLKEGTITEQNKEAVKTFIDIVQKVRKAQQEGKQAIAIPGDLGQNYIFTIRTNLEAGVFNKCANYLPALHEDVGITLQPQPSVDALAIGQGQSRTGLTTQLQKVWSALGVGAAASIMPSAPSEDKKKPEEPDKKPVEGAETKEEAGTGSGGETTGGGADTIADTENTPPPSLE